MLVFYRYNMEFKTRKFKITHKLVRQTSFVVLLLAVFTFAGYQFGKAGFEVSLRENSSAHISILNKTPQTQVVDLSPFWQVWDILTTQSLYRPLDAEKLLHGAIKGLTDSLDDPYTTFLSPQQNKTAEASLNGEYEGIGAELGLRDGQLVVVAPLEGSPAKRVGVRSGDYIVKIEGESTAGISLTEAVSKIKGKAGTISNLTLYRDSTGVFSVNIVRAKITVPGVSWENKSSGVAYIRLSRFGENTTATWSNIVDEIQEEMLGLRAIVLDVRSNPGGYLSAGIYIASEFISSGAIVLEDFGGGNIESFKISHKGELVDVPVVVLVDGGSASASEIVAGALRERIGAILVGDRTFGKGTVQIAKDLSDGSGVHVTIARWLTPDGNNIHDVGLEPDVTISFDEETEVDDQLEKALEIAKSL